MHELAPALWGFSAALAEGRFVDACRQAQLILQEFRFRQIVSQVLPSLDEVQLHWTGQLHLGFLLAAEAEADFLQAVSQHGWRPAARFPSQIAARELAHRAGQPELATSICKLVGPKGWALEAFIPQLPRSTVESWTAQGVVTHLGMELSQRQGLDLLLRHCIHGPFRPADFLQGELGLNEGQEILVLYLDGLLSGVPLRLEFCVSSKGGT